jgi:hypothetical protein
VFSFVCRDKDGKIKWTDTAKNLVTNAGMQHMLDTEFSGGTAITTWYLGLADNTPTFAAGDTLASHGGWTEFDEYTGDRKAWVEVRSGQTLTNSASVASFAITGAGGGVGGAFLAGAATGTASTLMSGAALSGGNRTVANGDTVELTYQFSAADDGA